MWGRVIHWVCVVSTLPVDEQKTLSNRTHSALNDNWKTLPLMPRRPEQRVVAKRLSSRLLSSSTVTLRNYSGANSSATVSVCGWKDCWLQGALHHPWPFQVSCTDTGRLLWGKTRLFGRLLYLLYARQLQWTLDNAAHPAASLTEAREKAPPRNSVKTVTAVLRAMWGVGLMG